VWAARDFQAQLEKVARQAQRARSEPPARPDQLEQVVQLVCPALKGSMVREVRWALPGRRETLVQLEIPALLELRANLGRMDGLGQLEVQVRRVSPLPGQAHRAKQARLDLSDPWVQRVNQENQVQREPRARPDLPVPAAQQASPDYKELEVPVDVPAIKERLA